MWMDDCFDEMVVVDGMFSILLDLFKEKKLHEWLFFLFSR